MNNDAEDETLVPVDNIAQISNGSGHVSSPPDACNKLSDFFVELDVVALIIESSALVTRFLSSMCSQLEYDSVGR
jgi:hypothetical protein